MAPRITAARCQNLRVDDEAEWLASLRPSQIRKVQAGATSWAEVGLIDIESGYGSVLRCALETFGLRISRVLVGPSPPSRPGLVGAGRSTLHHPCLSRRRGQSGTSRARA